MAAKVYVSLVIEDYDHRFEASRVVVTGRTLDPESAHLELVGHLGTFADKVIEEMLGLLSDICADTKEGEEDLTPQELNMHTQLLTTEELRALILAVHPEVEIEDEGILEDISPEELSRLIGPISFDRLYELISEVTGADIYETNPGNDTPENPDPQEVDLTTDQLLRQAGGVVVGKAILRSTSPDGTLEVITIPVFAFLPEEPAESTEPDTGQAD